MFTSAMKFSSVFAVFIVLAATCYAAREKRFLSPRTWAFLPERLLRLPDHDIGSSRFDSPFTSLLKSPSLDSIFGVTNRESLKTNETPKEVPTKNVHREMEDPVEEGESKVHAEEVFVDPPSRPDPESEKNPVDKEIPIFVKSFSFNPLTFNFDVFTPWWKGPNVCVERNEIDETDPEDESSPSGFMINFEATQCSSTESAYTCTRKIRRNGIRKTIIIKHQCCHGFDKKIDGKPGCSEVSMVDTIETMKAMEASKFTDLILLTSMKEKILVENFTIFAPTNDAVVDFEEESENNEIMNALPKKDFSYLVGGHIVEGLVNLGSVKDDSILQSVNGKTTIRINKYQHVSQMVTTANCVPVTSKNNMAMNGIVHMVLSLLPLPQLSVVDIIAESPKAAVFSKLLSNTNDLLAELNDSKKSWTLFVPTDKAFQNMNSELLQRLLTGEGCFESILRNHMVKGTYCSPGIVGQFRVRNALGKPLTVSQDEIERYKVDGIKISGTDIVGTNGVIHYIDEVMIPSEAKGILEALEKREDLMELIKIAELESTFENLNNVTFFAPSKEAIKGISNDTMQEWINNPKLLQEILMYHMVSPRTPLSEFKNNQELASLAEDRNVHVQLHEVFPGIAVGASAQCSLVTGHDHEVCGSMIHYLDKVIMPPKGSIVDVLKSTGQHKTLLKLLESTNLETVLSNEKEGAYTLLAPNDEAFEKLSEDSLQKLLENKTKAEQIVRMHVLPGTLCCSGVSPISFPFRNHYVRSLEGNLLPVHRRYLSDGVRFGSARAIECDLTANNGLVHNVNRVILPNVRRQNPFLLDGLLERGAFEGLF